MKRAIFRISGEMLLSMFAEGLKPMHEIVAGLPKDAKIINVRHGWQNEIDILLESETFSPVNEGSELPFLTITARTFAPSEQPLI